VIKVKKLESGVREIIREALVREGEKHIGVGGKEKMEL